MSLANSAFVLLSLTVAVGWCRFIDIPFPDRELPVETPEEVFQRSDVNNDQQLTFDEFLRTELIYVLMKEEEFKGYDTNRDGLLTLKEYENVHKQNGQQKSELDAQYFARLFEEFDEDFDMKLNEDEVRKILMQRFYVRPRRSFSNIFKSFDKDNDGALDISEYLNFDENVNLEDMDPVEAFQNPPNVNLLKREKLPMVKKFKKLYSN